MEEDGDFGFTNDIYRSFFQMNFEWPCLSFDIIRDVLGASRTDFPHTAYFISGTQAETEDDNQLLVTKLSELQCTKFDDEIEDESSLQNAKLKVCGNHHPSCVNRVRSMIQSPNIIATWTELNGVLIWDVSAAINASNYDSEGQGSVEIIHECPMDDEGFALAWSPTLAGQLAIGGADGKIQLWTQQGGSFVLSSNFDAHADSIEDIVYSPSDLGVFASCSCDKCIVIWDSRDYSKPVAKFEAHKSDVNVIDWNTIQRNLIVSGADDGVFSVWDLRMVGNQCEPAATFNFHEDPITSIQWNPNDESEIAVACDDGRVTIWDLSVEAVDPEEREEGIPDQMMFEHPIDNPKELRYHPQIPSLIAVTGDTFDIFIPDIVADNAEEEDKK